MSASQLYWQSYWINLNDAKHRYSTNEWLRFYAKELALYFPDQPVRALELGCGNGELHNFLSPHFSTFVGTDFSLAMLAKFKSRWPNLHLVCADGSRLPLGYGSYDLIFSNGVCQYMDQGMLKNNLRQVYSLLDTAGVYLIGNIPDAQLRYLHYVGGLSSDKDTSWLKLTRYFVATLIKRKSDGIGQWYSRRAISKLAGEHGFACQTFSSSSYEYRFHAVLKRLKKAENLSE